MGKCPTFYRKGELAPKSLANTLYLVCLCVFVSIFRQPQTMLSASVNAFHLRKTAFRWFFRSCGAISQAISTNHPAIGHSPAPAICKKISGEAGKASRLRGGRLLPSGSAHAAVNQAARQADIGVGQGAVSGGNRGARIARNPHL